MTRIKQVIIQKLIGPVILFFAKAFATALRQQSATMRGARYITRVMSFKFENIGLVTSYRIPLHVLKASHVWERG
jgi:hypothetical protein